MQSRAKAFTLIELLVVVAIIGILAAIGVVAYNGYTNSAKVAVSKSNHNTVVKKLNLLIQECDISSNGKVKLMLKQGDKTKYEKGCWYDVNTYLFFREYFTNDLNNSIEWKNNHTKEPWGQNYVATSGDSWACTQEKYIGYAFVHYTTSTKKIDVCTCVDSPCSNSTNVLSYQTQWQ
jgi:type IV pilus assembly protein PilA